MTVVETSCGRVRGRTDEGVHAFLGVPYAAPVTGAARFRPPSAHQGWAGVREATGFGQACPQRPLSQAYGARPAVFELLPMFGIPTQVANQGEHCLVLNIWTPTVAPGEKRPVLVWLHGGTDFGASDWPRFHGGAIARAGDMVVVTLNHRLGIFGHLDLSWTGRPEFEESGNAGLLDLRAALDWLHQNLPGFGGDPDNITVAGGSRGAARLAALISGTAPRPPFQRAIMVSPPPPRRVTRLTPREAAEAALHMLEVRPEEAAKLADKQVAELLDVQARLFANRRFTFQPTVAGSPVEEHCYADLAAGVAPGMPLMLGSTLNETARTIDADPGAWDGLSETELAERCSHLARGDVSGLIDAYRQAHPRDSPRRLAIAVTTDALYRFPTLALASARSTAATAPTYSYLFTGGTGSHGEDVLYFFDNLACAPLVPGNPANRKLAGQASSAWIAFCHNGVPEVRDLARWPEYTDGGRKTLVFGNPTRVVTDPFADRRAEWVRCHAGSPR